MVRSFDFWPQIQQAARRALCRVFLTGEKSWMCRYDSVTLGQVPLLSICMCEAAAMLHLRTWSFDHVLWLLLLLSCDVKYSFLIMIIISLGL